MNNDIILSDHKAARISEKHFGGKATKKQIQQMVNMILVSPTHHGQSDHSDIPGMPGPYAVVGKVAGHQCVVLFDAVALKEGQKKVVTFYKDQRPEVTLQRSYLRAA